MDLIKNDIPILEYDPTQDAVIMPTKMGYNFPSKAVFPFLGDEVDKYAQRNNCEKIGEFENITKVFPVYLARHNNIDICLCPAPLGSSAAVQIMDCLIGHGVKEIISVGSCGALVDLPENVFLIPTEALRDEGASYHYLPPARTVRLNSQAILAIQQTFSFHGMDCKLCKTWTTDGFFRETANMVKYRREEGYSVVEMECAGLAACAAYRSVTFGQFLYTADSLADLELHDERDWGKDSKSISLKIALDAVCAL